MTYIQRASLDESFNNLCDTLYFIWVLTEVRFCDALIVRYDMGTQGAGDLVTHHGAQSQRTDAASSLRVQGLCTSPAERCSSMGVVEDYQSLSSAPVNKAATLQLQDHQRGSRSSQSRLPDACGSSHCRLKGQFSSPQPSNSDSDSNSSRCFRHYQLLNELDRPISTSTTIHKGNKHDVSAVRDYNSRQFMAIATRARLSSLC